MLTQAQSALVGQFEPNTSTVKEGVAQIHDNIAGVGHLRRDAMYDHEWEEFLLIE